METKPFEEILELAIKARSDLWLSGFISEAENNNIHERIKNYREKCKADEQMSKETL